MVEFYLKSFLYTLFYILFNINVQLELWACIRPWPWNIVLFFIWKNTPDFETEKS